MNRARLDPLGEAARFGIDLNADLLAGTISGGAKAPLAPNALLRDASIEHSDWMIRTDTFSHTGEGGSSPSDRMGAAGYSFEGTWRTGENLSVRTMSSFPEAHVVSLQHEDLFLSEGHRTNLLNPTFQETGVGALIGPHTFPGYDTVDSSMLTVTFAKSGSTAFLTGVVYDDRDNDTFYTPGEGQGDVQIVAGGGETASFASGGYSLEFGHYGSTPVQFVDSGEVLAEALVQLAGINAKIDLVDGAWIQSSVDIHLVSGAPHARLLGSADLDANGTDARNRIAGNDGDNALKGHGGGDRLFGQDGDDMLDGANGHDRLFGHSGQDLLEGGRGRDLLKGGGDDDMLNGGGGHDRLFGHAGQDVLEGEWGRDLLKGGGHDDMLKGGGGHDRLFGQAGQDVLLGWRGEDTLKGGAHNDLLKGGGHDDLLVGQKGNDRLIGHAGNDVLKGGAGSDILEGGGGRES